MLSEGSGEGPTTTESSAPKPTSAPSAAAVGEEGGRRRRVSSLGALILSFGLGFVCGMGWTGGSEPVESSQEPAATAESAASKPRSSTSSPAGTASSSAAQPPKSKVGSGGRLTANLQPVGGSRMSGVVTVTHRGDDDVRVEYRLQRGRPGTVHFEVLDAQDCASADGLASASVKLRLGDAEGVAVSMVGRAWGSLGSSPEAAAQKGNALVVRHADGSLRACGLLTG